MEVKLVTAQPESALDAWLKAGGGKVQDGGVHWYLVGAALPGVSDHCVWTEIELRKEHVAKRDSSTLAWRSRLVCIQEVGNPGHPL